MHWPYHFIDLTDVRKQERRELLDRYATTAQLSALAPLLTVQILFVFSRLRTRLQNHGNLDPPSSPYLKGENLHSSNWLDRTRSLGRKVQWWLGEEQWLGDVEGTRGQVIFALTWSTWLSFLCFVQTGDDYLHLTKRFGIVAASQLPCQYLLAIKTPYSPLQLLTRKTHETLNVYHRFLGKTISFLLYLHAILYLNFYIQKSLLIGKFQEFYVLCGIFGVIAFKVISIPPIKHKSYRIFYTIHMTLASLLLPVLFFHVSHLRIYLYESAAIYALHIFLRHRNSTTVNATLTPTSTGSPDTKLLDITVYLPAGSPQLLHSYHPAQHTYLSIPTHPLSRTINSNPFTLASLPSTDRALRFLARVHAGNTVALAAAADYPTTSDPVRLLTGVPANVSFALEGPYGLPSHPDRLLSYDRILLVAGGVGATFIVPLYRQLLSDLSPSAGSYRRERVQLIWAVRRAEETSWALPEDAKERAGFVEKAEIYVTGNAGSERAAGEGIELQTRSTLRSDPEGAAGEDEEQKRHELRLHKGRPDLRALVDETFTHSASERVAVMVCGPKSLSRELRREVGRWVMGKGREVWWWEESFGT